MTLSSLRSWCRATDNHLITKVGLASSAPARLSHRFTTQTVWRRNLSQLPARRTLHSPMACHSSSGCPNRRLHSHLAAAEKTEPGEASSTAAEATNSFQRRRLRARQLMQAKVSQIPAVRLTEGLHSRPKPRRSRGRTDRKLGNATRATQEVAAEIPNEEDQESTIKSATGSPQSATDFFDTWGPVEAADVEHLQALQAAVGAAQKAEDLARWAEKATKAAEAAKASRNENFAIQLANAARTESELAALDAKQKAQHAEEKEETAEAVRAEAKALLEKELSLRATDRSHLGLPDKLMGVVDSPCRACHQPHPLTRCPHVFPALRNEHSHIPRRCRMLFRDKMELDKKFREAISFVQSTFQVGPRGIVLPLSMSTTRDAPASSIKYLQELNSLVYRRHLIRATRLPGQRFHHRVWDVHSGYYITEDDDGMRFAILWLTDAPADIATDPDFLPEIQKIRSFKAAWRKGQKSQYGQDPFGDMPSIDIVICHGRWHLSSTQSKEMFRSVLSLYISNENLWNQGLYYKGIHIGTKDNELTSDYDWWSYSRPEMHGSPLMNMSAAPIHTSLSEARYFFANCLLRATLRNVAERVPPVSAKDLKGKDPEALSRWQEFINTVKSRAQLKYGRTSAQYRLMSRKLDGAVDRRAAILESLQWVPSWETIMRLGQDGQDGQDFEASKPRPPPRTLRRRRLQLPRPSPASDSTPADHVPSRSRDSRLSSIMSPDTAPGTEAVRSGSKEAPEEGQVSFPSTPSQQKTPGRRTRRILSPADHARNKTAPSFETEENTTWWVPTPPETRRRRSSGYRADVLVSALDFEPETAAGGSEAEGVSVRRRVSRPSKTRHMQPRSSPYRTGELLSTLDLTPETADGGSEPEGREPVDYRPRAWNRRRHEGAKKFHNPRARRHEFPVPDVGDSSAF